jgi:hypothetical protein
MFGNKKLNKKEKKHLREMKIRTKYDFERQILFLLMNVTVNYILMGMMLNGIKIITLIFNK